MNKLIQFFEEEPTSVVSPIEEPTTETSAISPSSSSETICKNEKCVNRIGCFYLDTMGKHAKQNDKCSYFRTKAKEKKKDVVDTRKTITKITGSK